MLVVKVFCLFFFINVNVPISPIDIR